MLRTCTAKVFAGILCRLMAMEAEGRKDELRERINQRG